MDGHLVSASNKELQQAIRDGAFREGLYFRLADVTVFVPPLRDRRADIPLLVERFWSELPREILLEIEQAQWPGKVRQLGSAVERLFVLLRDDEVRRENVTAAGTSGDRPRAAEPSGEDQETGHQP